MKVDIKKGKYYMHCLKISGDFYQKRNKYRTYILILKIF